MTTQDIYLEEYNEVISKLTSLATSGNFVFRGYSIQSQILPNLIRNNIPQLEKLLLSEFERYGNQYINTNNPIDFMSYAQHFGLSTRLLDFTYNPFIALYFSLFKDKSGNMKEEDKDYYYIRYCDLHENILINHVPFSMKKNDYEINSIANLCQDLIHTVEDMFYHNYKSSLSFFSTIASTINSYDPEEYIKVNTMKVNNKRLLFIDPNQSNQRLIMQQGLFLFPYSLEESNHRELLYRNSNVLKIHKNLRPQLQTYLDTIGINAFRLMPDLSSVCEAVERKVKEEQRTSRKNKSATGNVKIKV